MMPSNFTPDPTFTADATFVAPRVKGADVDPFPAEAASKVAPESDTLGPQAYLNGDSRAGLDDNGKPSYTIDQAASQIVRGEPGWSHALGVGFTVTYAYRADEPTN